MPKSIYFNIEDDTGQIVERIKRERGDRFVLVFPRKSYVFGSEVNLKLLKKQLDLLGKHAAVLTMDEKGQAFASGAGFELVDVPKRVGAGKFGDIRVKAHKPVQEPEKVKHPAKTKVEVKTQAHHAPAKKTITRKAEEPKDTPKKSQEVKVASVLPRVQVEENIFADVPHKPAAKLLSGFGKPKHSKWLLWLSGFAILVFIGAVLITVVLPHAEIAVTPKSELISRQINIRAASEYASADVDLLRLPAKTFEKEISESAELQVVGKKEVGTKSSGKIRIFNLSGTPLNLKAGTTTLTSKDKQYTLTADANYIPNLTAKAATSPNAGFLASVEASGFGETYNLETGARLEITNQVFGNKPDQLYAVVEDSISGGSSRFVSEIQNLDEEEAKKQLVEKALDNYKDELTLDGWVLAEDSYTLDVANFSMDKPVGTEATTYTATLVGNVSGLIFKPEALQSLVRARVEQVLPEETFLQDPAKDKLSFELSDLNLQQGSVTITVSLASAMYRSVDLESLRSKAKGVNIESFVQGEKENTGIENIEVSVFPKQRKSFPILVSKISTSIKEKE